MEKLKTSDFIELTKKLSSSPPEFSDESLVKLIRCNILQLHSTLSNTGCFKEFYDLLKETQPKLAMSHAFVNELSNYELVSVFVEWNLFLLEQFSLTLTKEMRKFKIKSTKTSHNNSPENLNSLDQKSLFNCVDFVVIFGVSLQLSPGVGSDNRYPVIQELRKDVKSDDSLLSKSICTLMDLHSLKFSSLLRDYIRLVHFNTLLAGLFQISYNTQQLALDEDDESNEEENCYDKYLTHVVHSSNPQFIFKQLLQLLSGPSLSDTYSVKVPMWLLVECSIRVKECILRENGVKNLIIAFSKPKPIHYADESNPISASSTTIGNKKYMVDWRQCDFISHTITHLSLASFPSSEFFSIIAFQIITLLKDLYIPDEDNDHYVDECPMTVPVLVRLMAYIFQNHPSIFTENILNIIAAPIISMATTDNETETEVVEVVDELSLTTCLEMLHELLVIFHYPKSTLSTCLLPFIEILFNLYKHTHSSLSYLRSTVEGLVHRLIGSLQAREAVSLIIKFSGLEEPTKEDQKEDKDLWRKIFQRSSSSLSIFYKMNPLYSIVAAPHGGIAVMKEMYKTDKVVDDLEDIESRCEMVMTMLSNLSKSIVVKFFMECLQLLINLVGKDLTENKCLSSLPSKKPLETFDWYKNLKLLVLLTGLVNQYDDVTKTNFDKIIIFCRAALEYCINLMENDKTTVFHEHILAFVTFLLLNIFDQTKNTPLAQWEMASLLLPNLRRLSHHHNSSKLRSSCHQAFTLIHTRGKSVGNPEAHIRSKEYFDLVSSDFKSILKKGSKSEWNDSKPSFDGSCLKTPSLKIKGSSDNTPQLRNSDGHNFVWKTHFKTSENDRKEG